jgi:hypothetical protein
MNIFKVILQIQGFPIKKAQKELLSLQNCKCEDFAQFVETKNGNSIIILEKIIHSITIFLTKKR